MIAETPDGCILTVHIQPRASRTEYVGVHGAALKFRVAAPPVDGAANAALCQYLAAEFGLARNAVSVESGHTGRHKRIRLRGVARARVEQVFGCSTRRP